MLRERGYVEPVELLIENKWMNETLRGFSVDHNTVNPIVGPLVQRRSPSSSCIMLWGSVYLTQRVPYGRACCLDPL